MRRIALFAALLLIVSATALAEESPAPFGTEDRLLINPIVPTPPAPAEEDREVIGVIGDYLWARVRDFADIFTVKLGWGTDRSIGFQVRVVRPLQVGLGVFEGYQFVMDRGCVGVMKEAEIEGGISIFYPSYIVRQVSSQTDDAKRRNVFFNDVGETGELTDEAMKYYDDENNGWFTSSVQAQLPYLPKVELGVNWGELIDFPLSFFQIPGLRVPPPFYKRPGPDGGEMIPAPSIFWHGQERFEKY